MGKIRGRKQGNYVIILQSKMKENLKRNRLCGAAEMVQRSRAHTALAEHSSSVASTSIRWLTAPSNSSSRGL